MQIHHKTAWSSDTRWRHFQHSSNILNPYGWTYARVLIYFLFSIPYTQRTSIATTATKVNLNCTQLYAPIVVMTYKQVLRMPSKVAVWNIRRKGAVKGLKRTSSRRSVAVVTALPLVGHHFTVNVCEMNYSRLRLNWAIEFCLGSVIRMWPERLYPNFVCESGVCDPQSTDLCPTDVSKVKTE